MSPICNRLPNKDWAVVTVYLVKFHLGEGGDNHCVLEVEVVGVYIIEEAVVDGNCLFCTEFVGEVGGVLCVHIVAVAVDGQECVVHAVFDKVEAIVEDIVVIERVARDIVGLVAVVEDDADGGAVAVLRLHGVEGDAALAPNRVGGEKDIVVAAAEVTDTVIRTLGCEDGHFSVAAKNTGEGRVIEPVGLGIREDKQVCHGGGKFLGHGDFPVLEVVAVTERVGEIGVDEDADFVVVEKKSRLCKPCNLHCINSILSPWAT